MTHVPKRAVLDPCPVEATLTVVGGRWTSRILFFLSKGDLTLPELLTRLPGARQQVMRARLKHLQTFGLVRREAVKGAHQIVRYRLTPEGRDLIPVLEAMRRWGEPRIGGWVEPS